MLKSEEESQTARELLHSHRDENATTNVGPTESARQFTIFPLPED